MLRHCLGYDEAARASDEAYLPRRHLATSHRAAIPGRKVVGRVLLYRRLVEPPSSPSRLLIVEADIFRRLLICHPKRKVLREPDNEARDLPRRRPARCGQVDHRRVTGRLHFAPRDDGLSFR